MKGFDVLEATSGKEGLDLLVKNKIDLVITDYHMPDGDGTYLLNALRNELKSNVPVIICSGGSNTKHEDFFRQGPTVVLDKPINMHKLVDIIRNQLSI